MGPIRLRSGRAAAGAIASGKKKKEEEGNHFLKAPKSLGTVPQ